MKNYWLGIVTIVLVSCSGSSDSIGTPAGDILGTIESKAIIGDVTAEEYDPSWMNVKNRKVFLNDFFGKVRAGDFPVYEYIPDTLIPMSKKAIEYTFFHVDTDYAPINALENDTVIFEERIDPDGIVYLKFKEELYYDNSNGKMEKVIKMVCPMEKIYNEDGTERGYKGLFWVKVN